jgi:hypothetical protein
MAADDLRKLQGGLRRLASTLTNLAADAEQLAAGIEQLATDAERRPAPPQASSDLVWRRLGSGTLERFDVTKHAAAKVLVSVEVPRGLAWTEVVAALEYCLERCRPPAPISWRYGRLLHPQPPGDDCEWPTDESVKALVVAKAPREFLIAALRDAIPDTEECEVGGDPSRSTHLYIRSKIVTCGILLTDTTDEYHDQAMRKAGPLPIMFTPGG